MKKKKVILKKKADAVESAKNAAAAVVPLEILHTAPIPSGPGKLKKNEVKNEKSKDADGSDHDAAAAVKRQRELDEAAVSGRKGGNAAGSGKRGRWDFIDDFPGF
jgi:hypothetical protein